MTDRDADVGSEDEADKLRRLAGYAAETQLAHERNVSDKRIRKLASEADVALWDYWRSLEDHSRHVHPSTLYRSAYTEAKMRRTLEHEGQETEPEHEPTKELPATVSDAQALALVVLAAKGIDPDCARRLIRQARQLEATLPITDPTLFRHTASAIHSSARVAAAFLAFRKVIDDEIPASDRPVAYANHPTHDGN